MVRMNDLDPELRDFLNDYRMPAVPGAPWVEPAAPHRRRVALVSSAGLRLPEDRPFGEGAGDWRAIPGARAGEAVMDHLSVSHDRSGFQRDLDVVFPVERLRELAAAGEIGGEAPCHYSFMGASDVGAMEAEARALAGRMRAEGVNTVVLVPV